MEKNETYLTKLFHSNSQETELRLSESQIAEEIQFLNSFNDEGFDTLLVLFIIEKLNLQTKRVEFFEACIKLIKSSPKYYIFNLRILNLLQKNMVANNIFFPFCNPILNMTKKLHIANEGKYQQDLNKLKVGSDVSQTSGYVEFILEKLLQALMKNLNLISSSLGFPEISFWVVKELKNIEIEGKSKIIIAGVILQIEEQNKKIKEIRNTIKKENTTKSDIKKIENTIEKMI